MNIDLGYVTAGCAVLMAIFTVIGFWMRFERRMTEANSTADAALQTAAEAVEDCKEAERRLNEIEKHAIENADLVRREFGETVLALRENMHKFETWSRDEFVRKASLEALMARLEKAQEMRDARLEKRLDGIDKKLDEASASRTHQ